MLIGKVLVCTWKRVKIESKNLDVTIWTMNAFVTTKAHERYHFSDSLPTLRKGRPSTGE